MDKAFRPYFSEEDLKRISAAIAEAEKKTSGEIVPYFVLQSDLYAAAHWRAAALTGGTVLAVAVAVFALFDAWLPVTLIEAVMGALLFAGIAALLVHTVPPLRRLFIGGRIMEHRVHQRAREAFLSEEVFRTRERTGILILLSLFERRVVVLGDSGINARVTKEHWNSVVRLVTNGMREGRAADGFVRAIARCGELLQEHGLARRADDKDELSDNLRMSKQ